MRPARLAQTEAALSDRRLHTTDRRFPPGIQQRSGRWLLVSKRGTEIAGHVETAAQPGIAEARGELDATAAKDESRNTGDADLPLLLLAVAAVVPDDDVRLRDGRQSCASPTTRGCRRKREQSLPAASLWLLAQEPDVDPARVPEATGAPIRGHRRRDRDRFDGVGDQPSPSR